jgi:hypothetical protein
MKKLTFITLVASALALISSLNTRTQPTPALEGVPTNPAVSLNRALQPLVIDVGSGLVAYPDGDRAGLDQLNSVEQRQERLSRIFAILNPVSPDDFTGMTADEVAQRQQAAESIEKAVFLVPRTTAEAQAMANALAGIQPVSPLQPSQGQ